MIIKCSKHGVFALITLGSLTYASSPAVGSDFKSAKESVQQTIYEITGKDSSVIKFEPGSSKPPASAAAELKTMLNAIRSSSVVKEILVLAYSDLPYPAGQAANLPEVSQSLANRRGAAVLSMLREAEGTNLNVISMAVKSSWFDRALQTREALIKKEADLEPSDSSQDDLFYEAIGRKLKADGASGTVVVVIRHSV